MAKTYYKVVSRDGPDAALHSAIVNNPQYGFCVREEEGLRLTYSSTQWTLGCNGTPVIAFESRCSALAFGACSRNFEVWEAKVKRPRKLNMVGARNLHSSKSSLLAFWERIKDKRWSQLSDTIPSSMDAPRNTVACDAIKLVKKVA